jgi:hypothetical protein
MVSMNSRMSLQTA